MCVSAWRRGRGAGGGAVGANGIVGSRLLPPLAPHSREREEKKTKALSIPSSARARRDSLPSATTATPDPTPGRAAGPALHAHAAFGPVHPMRPTAVEGGEASHSGAPSLSASPAVPARPPTTPPPPATTSAPADAPTCRICWDVANPGEPGGTLVSPCACTGTAAHVHVACLAAWVHSPAAPRPVANRPAVARRKPPRPRRSPATKSTSPTPTAGS